MPGIASVATAMMWLANDGTMWRRMIRMLLGPVEPRCGDEIFGLERQHLAAHDTRQLGPAKRGEDDGDDEIGLQRGPVARHGSGKAEPERDLWQRPDELDDPLDHHVGAPTDKARDAADDDAEQEAERRRR